MQHRPQNYESTQWGTYMVLFGMRGETNSIHSVTMIQGINHLLIPLHACTCTIVSGDSDQETILAVKKLSLFDPSFQQHHACMHVDGFYLYYCAVWNERWNQYRLLVSAYILNTALYHCGVLRCMHASYILGHYMLVTCLLFPALFLSAKRTRLYNYRGYRAQHWLSSHTQIYNGHMHGLMLYN